jgi:N-acetylmuramoyl-L-alanine amidase
MSLKKFIPLLLALIPTACIPFFSASYQHQEQPYSIMIDPAGDAQWTGRVIETSFERGITMQCAQELKKELEHRHGASIRVILTRIPGETAHALATTPIGSQNAEFTNKIGVDLYISLHFCYKKQAKPSLELYRFLSSPTTDLWARPAKLSFYPFDQAHLYSVTKTSVIADQFRKVLCQQLYAHLFEYKEVIGLPLKPLLGVQVPALLIEASLSKQEEWNLYVEPLSQAISHIIELAGQGL